MLDSTKSWSEEDQISAIAPVQDAQAASDDSMKDFEDMDNSGYMDTSDDMNASGYMDDSEDTQDARYESLITGAFGKTYVSAEAKYEDLKSSASALMIVGILLSVVTILQARAIISLPLNSVSIAAIAVIGIASLIGSIMTYKSANIAKANIQVEARKRKEIIDWCLKNYSAQIIDKRVMAAETENMIPDEIMALKRMSMIQSFIQREFQIEEEGFLEVLAEEIYDKIYDIEEE